jgi:hypothetical protein
VRDLTPLEDGYVDYLGRPWAQTWQKHFELGWQHPSESPSAVLAGAAAPDAGSLGEPAGATSLAGPTESGPASLAAPTE